MSAPTRTPPAGSRCGGRWRPTESGVADRTPLLRAEQVVKHFPAGLGASVKAGEKVSLEIYPGETVGLVGESGCGKSTLGRLITQLLPVTSGNIFFDGVDLTKLRGEKLRQYRRQLQMIFQDPYSSLDPRMTVGDIVADEPISALDVSIQAQIINLMEDLQKEFQLTYLFIAHDLSVVRHISDRVMVMYLGKIVEVADSVEIYRNPRHPYTKALLSAIPIPDPEVQSKRRIVSLSGEIPSPFNPPSGCRFHTRCPIAQLPTPCADQGPPLEDKARDHRAACFFSEKVPVAV